MSARRRLRDALKAGLPAAARYTVLGYPTNDPGTVSRPVILAYQDKIEPAPEGDGSLLKVSLVVWVLVSDMNSRGEDVLETALYRTLDVLHAQDWLLFEEAQRQDFAGTHAGYRITLTARAAKE